MSTELPAIFREPEAWDYGPLLEIHLSFEQILLSQLSIGQSAEVLRILGIEGAYTGVTDVVNRLGRKDDWRDYPLYLGIWHLDTLGTTGVELGPIDEPYSMFLGIPPRFAEHICGSWPWNLGGQWVTPAVVTLHSIIIERLRELHKVLPIRSAIIHDEVWPRPESKDTACVLFHRSVAQVIGKVEAIDDWYSCTRL